MPGIYGVWVWVLLLVRIGDVSELCCHRFVVCGMGYLCQC